MRILITGGAGFIGSNIAMRFLENQHAVVVFDNLTTGYRENIPRSPKLEFIEGDIRNLELLQASIKGCQIVIHAAASVGNVRSLEHPQKDSDINVLGTLNVLEASKKEGVQKFVYSSSAGIFGELKKLPIDEDHPIAPDSPYGVSKLAGELHCLCYAKLYGLDTVCLRYFNVYGPNQRYDAYGNVIPIFATRKMKREPLLIYGDGEQTRDFVHVYDVAQANYLAATKGSAHGAYNIGSGKATTINQLAEWLNETGGGAKAPVHRVAPRKGEVKHSVASIEKAKKQLGYQPALGLQEGLKGYWKWINSL